MVVDGFQRLAEPVDLVGHAAGGVDNEGDIKRRSLDDPSFGGEAKLDVLSALNVEQLGKLLLAPSGFYLQRSTCSAR